MFRLIVPAAASLLLSSTAVFAADLAAPPVEPVAPVAPVVLPLTWTGFYVGAYAGGAFGTSDIKNDNGSTDVSLSPNGFTGGGLLGYNYQIDSFVLGVEGEFGYNGLSSDKDYVNSALETQNAKSESTYIGRVRGRVGYALDNVLFYAAGGVSFADDKVTQTDSISGNSASISKDVVGWNAGAGVEYAFTPNWIGRLEYIYDGFGDQKYNFSSKGLGFNDQKVSFDQSTVRAALEYKF